MRVVVDTNIFVNAALKSVSWPASVVRWIDTHGGLLKSLATEGQVIEVLQRPYIASRVPPSYLENVLHILSAEEVAITERIVTCRDPTDDKLLELAVNGRTDMTVTGDSDLLVLHPFRGIPIIDPTAFVQGVAARPSTEG